MLKCCKQDPWTASSYEPHQQKPTHKYSFRHNANVLTNSLVNQSQVFHYPNTQPNAAMHQEAMLQLQIQRLKKEQQEYNQFLANSVKPMEREVQFYERQVGIRAREISELQELLDLVVRQRNGKVGDLGRARGV